MASKRTTRNIHSVFTFKGETVKRNVGAYANTAVLNAVKHMRANKYGATVVEVFNARTGTLHAIVTRKIGGGEEDIKIVFKLKYRENA